MMKSDFFKLLAYSCVGVLMSAGTENTFGADKQAAADFWKSTAGQACLDGMQRKMTTFQFGIVKKHIGEGRQGKPSDKEFEYFTDGKKITDFEAVTQKKDGTSGGQDTVAQADNLGRVGGDAGNTDNPSGTIREGQTTVTTAVWGRQYAKLDTQGKVILSNEFKTDESYKTDPSYLFAAAPTRNVSYSELLSGDEKCCLTWAARCLDSLLKLDLTLQREANRRYKDLDSSLSFKLPEKEIQGVVDEAAYCTRQLLLRVPLMETHHNELSNLTKHLIDACLALVKGETEELGVGLNRYKTDQPHGIAWVPEKEDSVAPNTVAWTTKLGKFEGLKDIRNDINIMTLAIQGATNLKAVLKTFQGGTLNGALKTELLTDEKTGVDGMNSIEGAKIMYSMAKKLIAEQRSEKQ